MSVVGLDFGAKNAVIAAAGRGGVDVILNGNSNRLNPCMVGFDRSRTMGEAASSTAMSNYRNTIFNMKRLVGLAFDDPRAQTEMELAPFQCVPIKHGASSLNSIGVKVSYNGEEKVIPVEAVAGMMVKHMGTIAAAKTAAAAKDTSNTAIDANHPLFPQDWVVSIPGYYTDAQKSAFLTGCEIAGVKGVLRLMHETTATALAYGIFKDIRKEFAGKEKPTHVMFIDIGATAYSVAIVAFEPGKLTVKSTQGDPDLGGRDFDLAIGKWFAEKFEEKYKGKLSAKPMDKPKVMLKILAAAEKAKKTLSPAGVKETSISIECLMDDFDFSCRLKSTEYEEMCEPLLDRLASPIEKALKEAKLERTDLFSVEIVGGGSRVGCLKRKLASVLGLNTGATNNGLSTTMNADEAVARGTALQSAILSPRFKVLPYEIVEYQPYPIKIAWEGDVEGNEGLEVDGETEGSTMPSSSVIMFDRGSNFPVVRRVSLRRAGEFVVTATYDDTALNYNLPASAPKEIASFKIKAPTGAENKIRVNVKQNVHGIILLSSAQMVEEIIEEEPEEEKQAENMETEGEAKKEAEAAAKKKKIKKTNLDFTTSRPMEWSKKERDAAYEAEVEMANADRIVKETSEMRNELESYLYDMRDKIISESQLAPFCTDAERTAFSAALEQGENWLYEDGFDAIKSVYSEKLKSLKALGDPIQFRQSESIARPNAVSVLQRSVEKYKNWLNVSASEEKYAHITDTERSMCHEKCDEISSWMYDMLDKQGSLPNTANPAVTVSQIHEKSKELTNVVSPIMHKRPPPPPKVEEKKKEDAAAPPQPEAKAEGNFPEPMDTSDAAPAEKEPEKPKDPTPMETNE